MEGVGQGPEIAASVFGIPTRGRKQRELIQLPKRRSQRTRSFSKWILPCLGEQHTSYFIMINAQGPNREKGRRQRERYQNLRG